ncbi:MAG: hypothetical protein KGY53_07020 [Wenzhouxiangellaceae bacterium]|nr:hypothetical protein [Wenzhouxiangellaceae bacterium]
MVEGYDSGRQTNDSTIDRSAGDPDSAACHAAVTTSLQTDDPAANTPFTTGIPSGATALHAAFRTHIPTVDTASHAAFGIDVTTVDTAGAAVVQSRAIRSRPHGPPAWHEQTDGQTANGQTTAGALMAADALRSTSSGRVASPAPGLGRFRLAP